MEDILKHPLKIAHFLYQKCLISTPIYSIIKDLILSYDETVCNVFRELTLEGLQAAALVRPIPNYLRRIVNIIYEISFDKLYVVMKSIIEPFQTELANRVAIDTRHSVAGSDPSSLVYGEIEFNSFSDILKAATNGVENLNKFVDLGHGKMLCISMTYICVFDF
jgi:hypothetical protein